MDQFSALTYSWMQRKASQTLLPGRLCHSQEGEALPKSTQQSTGDPSLCRRMANAGLPVREEKPISTWLETKLTKARLFIIYQNKKLHKSFLDVTGKKKCYEFRFFSIVFRKVPWKDSNKSLLPKKQQMWA